MAYHVWRFVLEDGVGEALTETLFENDQTIVSTCVYVDIMQQAAVPTMIVVAQDAIPDVQVTAGRAPQGISPAGVEADPAAYMAWVSTRESEG